MKTIALSAIFCFMAVMARADVWSEWREKIFDDTKVTIHKDGGIAGFWDASAGNDYALKQGILSHVITNRFIAGSLGWYTADNQQGVIVGGPSVKTAELIRTFLPRMSEEISRVVPPILKPVDVGFNFGWGTDKSRHYGLHIVYGLGK